jgi:hypothetical protein
VGVRYTAWLRCGLAAVGVVRMQALNSCCEQGSHEGATGCVGSARGACYTYKVQMAVSVLFQQGVLAILTGVLVHAASVLHLQAAASYAGSAWRPCSSAVLNLQQLCAQRR